MAKNISLPAITIPYLPVTNTCSLMVVAEKMRLLPMYPLNSCNWPGYPYKPNVLFTIAFGSTEIYLHFQVSEKQVRAACLYPNDPVYEDSCVEFFIEEAETGGYTNFEFNCMGVCLAAFGPNRQNRVSLSSEQINKIQFNNTLSSTSIGVEWELTVKIPQELLTKNNYPFWQKPGWRANFYKCGDALADPHFLSWAPIQWPEPNFHLPAFFGELNFKMTDE